MNVLVRSFSAIFGLTLLSGVGLAADAPFKAETFTVEKAIKPGPNVLVNYASWDGSSKLHVYGQDGLEYKGLMGMGLTSQFVISGDGKKAYVLSDYMKRYTYGPIESVVQIFDIQTLTPISEIIVPNKAVKAIAMTQLIELSADEKILYVGVSDSKATRVVAYDVAADGTITNERTFFDAHPLLKGSDKGLVDGLKIDRKGNVWSSGPGGILVLSPAGKLLGRLNTGQATANCNWGDDGSTLYITAHMFLVRVKTLAKGAGWE